MKTYFIKGLQELNREYLIDNFYLCPGPAETHTHTRQLAPSQRPRTNQRCLGGERSGHFGQLEQTPRILKEGEAAIALAALVPRLLVGWPVLV